MPRGDKSKYTDKQERKADHIAEGYEKRGRNGYTYCRWPLSSSNAMRIASMSETIV